MSTPTSGDLLLVNRGGVNYQIDYDDMSTLQDTDLLLVNRAGVNYQIPASDLDLGPDGLILPSVDVLTPVNGAGLDEGSAYTPLSSAFVSTDTSPVYYRWWDNAMTVISGGSVSDQNNLFDGNTSTSALVGNSAAAVSQAVYNNLPSGALAGGREGETTVYAYAAGGGTIEVLDDDGTTVLRSYALPTNNDSTAIGIVRANDKIRFTTASVDTGLYLSHISIAGGDHQDFVITGRVKFDFTDDTDLDKMVAPIIQTDENGNVKVPTTSTVDSTTTIPGANKSLEDSWYGNGNARIYPASDTEGGNNVPLGNRMVWAKTDSSYSGIITDSVRQPIGAFLKTSEPDGAMMQGPYLRETESEYNNNSHWNAQSKRTDLVEIGCAPKVLDIQTWVGNSQQMRQINHNLGCKPGMILIKCTSDGNSDWIVWHNFLPHGQSLRLNEGNTPTTPYHIMSPPTKDAFWLNSGGDVNGNTKSYVAYIYAKDTAGKVKCGTYTGTGQSGVQIDIMPGTQLGFFLVKNVYGGDPWIAQTFSMSTRVKHWNPQFTDQLATANVRIHVDQGRLYFDGAQEPNQSGQTYIYLAVAADLTGPNSTQLNLLSGQDLEFFTTGTQITSNASASGSNISFGSTIYGGISNPRDINPTVSGQYFMDVEPESAKKWMLWIKSYDSSNGHAIFDSERPFKEYLNSAESQGGRDSGSTLLEPSINGSPGYRLGTSGYVNENPFDYISYNFVGAPQFFDVQKYVGSVPGEGHKVIQHDLDSEVGAVIIKNTSSDGTDWAVWHHSLGDTQMLYMNRSYGASTADGVAGNGFWCQTNENEITLGQGGWSQYNHSTSSHIAYLFARDTQYVKCGTYIGTGNSNYQVDVGFKPRWMMIYPYQYGGKWTIFDKNLPNKYIEVNSNNDQGSWTWNFTNTGINHSSTGNPANGGGTRYVYIAIADESEGHPPSAPSSSTVTTTPDPNSATMVVNAESFDVGDSASAPALEASITSIAGSEGNSLFVDSSTGTWMPGLYAKGSETTVSAPSADEITFTTKNNGTTAFTGVDANLTSRTWTLESGPSATGPWTVVDTYVDFDMMASQDGATPWTSNKPALAADTFYRVKVAYDSNNAESVESVYNTFKTSA